MASRIVGANGLGSSEGSAAGFVKWVYSNLGWISEISPCCSECLHVFLWSRSYWKTCHRIGCCFWAGTAGTSSICCFSWKGKWKIAMASERGRTAHRYIREYTGGLPGVALSQNKIVLLDKASFSHRTHELGIWSGQCYLDPIRKSGMRAHFPEDECASEVNES